MFRATAKITMCAKAIAALVFGLFTSTVFAQSSFDIADDNNDGRINKDEFYEVVAEANLFDDVDTNSDQQIDVAELEVFDQDALLTEWDLDQDDALNKREFYNGIYRHIDDDSDGYLNTFDWDKPEEKGWFGVYDEAFP